MTGTFTMKTAVVLLEAILLAALFTAAVNAQPAPASITFTGGPGDTPETAVVIAGAKDSIQGIAAEYQYLGQKFGRENADWSLFRQSLLQQGSKVYDRMELRLKGGARKTVFFDISEFFGKL